jgi:predicted acetyltransferase
VRVDPAWDDNRQDLLIPTLTEYADKPSVTIEIDPALCEHAPILANLLELYAHDFSEFYSLKIGVDGRFGYRSLPLYWSEPNRHPFLVRIDGQLAGLTLVKKGSEISGNQAVWDMAEFFVLRGCRRRGIGTLAAQQVWRRFPGLWEVRVMQSNHLAILFWETAISHFIGEAIQPVRVEKDGQYWQLFSFESKHVL